MSATRGGGAASLDRGPPPGDLELVRGKGRPRPRVSVVGAVALEQDAPLAIGEVGADVPLGVRLARGALDGDPRLERELVVRPGETQRRAEGPGPAVDRHGRRPPRRGERPRAVADRELSERHVRVCGAEGARIVPLRPLHRDLDVGDREGQDELRLRAEREERRQAHRRLRQLRHGHDVRPPVRTRPGSRARAGASRRTRSSSRR